MFTRPFVLSSRSHLSASSTCISKIQMLNDHSCTKRGRMVDLVVLYGGCSWFKPLACGFDPQARKLTYITWGKTLSKKVSPPAREGGGGGGSGAAAAELRNQRKTIHQHTFISLKSASPTPTMRIDKGRSDAFTRAFFVSWRSVITPS